MFYDGIFLAHEWLLELFAEHCSPKPLVIADRMRELIRRFMFCLFGYRDERLVLLTNISASIC